MAAKTIMSDLVQRIISTDLSGATFSRFSLGARMKITATDLENLRKYKLSAVNWPQIGQDYCVISTPSAGQYQFAATIGKQQNFLTLFFPAYKRIFRGLGIHPGVFDMLEGTMFDILELSLPGPAQSEIIDTVWAQFLRSTETELQHYIAQVSRFNVVQPGPAPDSAQFRATAATFLSAGEAVLHFSHSGGLGAATAAAAAALAVTTPAPVARPTVGGKGGKGAKEKSTAETIETPGAWVDKVEVSADSSLLRICGRDVFDVKAAAADIAKNCPEFKNIFLPREAKYMAFMFTNGAEPKRARFVPPDCPKKFLVKKPFLAFSPSEYVSTRDFI